MNAVAMQMRLSEGSKTSSPEMSQAFNRSIIAHHETGMHTAQVQRHPGDLPDTGEWNESQDTQEEPQTVVW